jgi:cell division inhibitor SulA/protein ImuA
MAAVRSSFTPVSAATRKQLAQLCRSAEDGGKHGALVSGFDELDRRLPRGGWPLGALIELLSVTEGIGELSLFLPALCHLARSGRYIAWIAPPYIPYAPALAQWGLLLERLLIIHTHSLAESLWATEQALRCPAVGAVLGWADYLVDKSLRRLQLAAEAGGGLGILHRPLAAAAEASPAALRLQLQPQRHGQELDIHILKARGGRAGWSWQLPHRDAMAVYSSARAGL